MTPEKPRASWQPNWAAMRKVASYATPRDALRALYRAERLNRPGTLDRLERDLGEELARSGFAMLASRHESNLGTALWARREHEMLVTYTRDHAAAASADGPTTEPSGGSFNPFRCPLGLDPIDCLIEHDAEAHS